MYPDRFDFFAAYYQFCSDWHAGQSCPLYEKLSRITEYYRPGIFTGYEYLSENAQFYYDQLCEKYLNMQVV